MSEVIGIISTMTPTPARTDLPSTIHSKYSEIHICSGADQSMLMYVISSMNLGASTDIRLTISPTVDFFREALLSFRDCNIQKNVKVWYTDSPKDRRGWC